MPVQVWIQTPKENVQKIKVILEDAGQLSKAQKVKLGQQEGYMIIPTKKYIDKGVNDETEYFQILSELYLRDACQCLAAEIIYLPASLPTSQNTEPKQGPIQEAILEWLQSLPEISLRITGTARTDLLEASPRRWSIYEPMLLLPSGTFQDAMWKAFLISVDEIHLTSLWKAILQVIWKKDGGKELTHLAVNSGIPSTQDFPITADQENHPASPQQDISSTPSPSAKENILRSPSGLILLHGSFGHLVTTSSPTAADFGSAFWVTSKQNGIFQTWAPRYTMFSRGNVKEKSRILGFHDADTATEAGKQVGEEERKKATVVDLYAGIGYFAFSYAAAGFRRVVCWEINPWSVEALRRGCERNGWGCRIIRGGDLGLPVEEMLRGGSRVVVFEEGNERAVERMEAVRDWEERTGEKVLGDVVHVNCGFLPSSEKSWRGAWRIVCNSRSAWLHLHENVGVDDVEKRRKEVERIIRQWATEAGSSQTVEVEHVELVKTFAPGVWHCVFDVHIRPSLTDGS